VQVEDLVELEMHEEVAEIISTKIRELTRQGQEGAAAPTAESPAGVADVAGGSLAPEEAEDGSGFKVDLDDGVVAREMLDKYGAVVGWDGVMIQEWAAALRCPPGLQDELLDAAAKLEIFDGGVLLEVQVEDLLELEVHAEIAECITAQMELLLRYDSESAV
jgi:hypothetical protein